MKIIEALKKIKDLTRKVDDLVGKIKVHSAYLSFETSPYDDQKAQVREWLQAHSDVLKEILRLQIGVQRTNLATEVGIELGGKTVVKTIAEWIHRRREHAHREKAAWEALTDRGLQEGTAKQSTGEVIDVKIVRCYDPKERDEKKELFSSEPMTIDSRLEVVNAVTDIIE